jgi:hypothetical protein
VAGAFDGRDEFSLYLWSGDRDSSPQLLDVTLPPDFRPEGIVFYPGENRLQLISDDGSIVRDGQTACKNLQNSKQKYFRSLWLTGSGF